MKHRSGTHSGTRFFASKFA